jgi:hypothetical protein
LPKSNEKLRKIILLLITWGVLLGLFIGYENYFVAGQKEYLIEQEFRNLSRLSGQLSAEFDRARLSVSSLAKIVHAPQKPPQGASPKTECWEEARIGECFEDYSKSYLGEVWDNAMPDTQGIQCLGANPAKARLEQATSSRGLEVIVPCTEEDQAQKKSKQPTEKLGPVLHLDMKPWVEEAFKDSTNSFDDVLVADEKGHVRFQMSATGPRIAELNSIVETGTDISTKQSVFGFLNPGAAAPPSAKPADASPGSDPAGAGAAGGQGTAQKKSRRLSETSSATNVSLGGKSYLLFAQPSPVEMGSDAERGMRWPLVVVGLRLAGGVEAESHALPYSVLIWAGLCGVVLLGFSWPLFKLQYMSNTERFRPIDGWVLIFTLLLISSGVMLMLLNASYLLRSREYTDGALRRIALQMRNNFSTELSQAFTQLEEVRGTDEFRNVSKNGSDPGLVGNYPIEKYLGQKYPYFEIAFWANCRGEQVAKVDIRRVPTPAVNLNRFPFYRVVKAKAGWTDPGTDKPGKKCGLAPGGQDTYENTFFQPVMSPNTNEFAPVLSSPFSPLEGDKPMGEGKAAGEIAMQALVFRPMSIINPVLPPGYAFAVVDGGCNVLFHSDTFRDLRENFCEESKDRTELRPWQLNGADTPLNITYGGRTKRAYLANFPFPGLSRSQAIYLLVYQEDDQQLTLDLAVIVVCSIFMGAYFVLLCIVVAGHFLLRGYFRWYYAPRIVWPCRDYAPQYLQIFFLCLLLCWLYRSFYHNLHEATLLALTLGVAILSVMFAIVRLTFHEDVVIRSGIAVTASALLLRLTVEIVRLSSGSHISVSAKASLLEWSRLLYLPMAAGAFAIVVCWPNESLLKRFPAIPRLTDAIKKGSRKYSDVLYALATVSLMFCISVVPCAGFFKYAYDAVSELSLKHDEAVLSERVIARRDRIENFYEQLKAPKLAAPLAAQRLTQTLDRYDQGGGSTADSSQFATFATCQEPTLDGAPKGKPCPPIAKEPPIDLGLNDWIEKRIAQATFWFPSNELGSEISRLGVAQTDEDKSWERYWLEPSATTFALQWKPKSRAPNFRISAEYPESHGLTTQARVALLVFVGVMVLWFTNLAKMIFLTGVEGAPAIEIVYWEKVEDIKRDSLVIGLPRSGKSAQLKKLAGLDPRDFRDLRDLRGENSSASKQCELERAESRSGVIVLDQFDFNMRDPAMNEKRLELVETLLESKDHKLVLVSTVDPMYFLAEERETVLCDGKDRTKAGILLERWARALDKFSRVRLYNQVGDEFAGAVGRLFELEKPFVQFARWICEECDGTPMLRKIGVELLEQYEKKTLPTREQIVELVEARADTYYRMVWAGLTSSERLVLYQLALDGWSNPKNTAAIHQLEQKKLIFRRPMYRIMNDSFRRFIRSSEHEREILSWQKTEQQSTWQALRFVIIAAIIGAGVWLLYAQAQLFQIGTGYITAIAALLTALAGITARARRSPAPPSAEPPPES